MPLPSGRSVQAWQIAVVVLAAVVLRAPLVISVYKDPSRALAPDSRDYMSLACELRSTGRFARPDGEPEIYRTPGYPAFLAVLGVRRDADAVRVVAVQMLADLALCVLVGAFILRFGRITGRLPDRAWLAGGFFQAFSVVSAVYAARVLSDSIFALLLFGTVWMTLEIMLRPMRSSNPLCAGNESRRSDPPRVVLIAWAVLLAVLPLWRAVALPFVLLHPVFLGLLRRRRVALYSIGAIVALDGGWVLRNTISAGYPGFSAVAALNLYRYEAAAVSAYVQRRAFAEVQAEFDQRLSTASSWPERARLARREAWGVLSRHPLLWGWIHVRSTLASLLPAAGAYLQACGFRLGGGTLSVLHDRGLVAAVRHFFRGRTWLLPLALLLCIPAGIKYLSGGAGILFMWRVPVLRTLCLYLGLTVVWFLVAPGPAAHPRFRVPVEPLVSVFAAAGIAYVLRRRQPMDPGAPAAATAGGTSSASGGNGV